jgi:hypothetical protein
MSSKDPFPRMPKPKPKRRRPRSAPWELVVPHELVAELEAVRDTLRRRGVDCTTDDVALKAIEVGLAVRQLGVDWGEA